MKLCEFYIPGGGLGIFTDRDQLTRVFLGFEFGESVFFWVLITAVVFFGLSNKSCILKCFLFSTVFLGFSYIHQVLQLNHGSLLLSYHA